MKYGDRILHAKEPRVGRMMHGRVLEFIFLKPRCTLYDVITRQVIILELPIGSSSDLESEILDERSF